MTQFARPQHAEPFAHRAERHFEDRSPRRLAAGPARRWCKRGSRQHHHRAAGLRTKDLRRNPRRQLGHDRRRARHPRRNRGGRPQVLGGRRLGPFGRLPQPFRIRHLESQRRAQEGMGERHLPTRLRVLQRLAVRPAGTAQLAGIQIRPAAVQRHGGPLPPRDLRFQHDLQRAAQRRERDQADGDVLQPEDVGLPAGIDGRIRLVL